MTGIARMSAPDILQRLVDDLEIGCLAPGVCFADLGQMKVVEGRYATLALLTVYLRDAFSSLSLEPISVADWGDSAEISYRLIGVQSHPFFGIPATGRGIAICFHLSCSLLDGKIGQLSLRYNPAILLRQLGVG